VVAGVMGHSGPGRNRTGRADRPKQLYDSGRVTSLAAMISEPVIRAGTFCAVALALSALLLGEGLGTTFPGSAGSAVRELTAVFRDPETQWIVFCCFGSYLATFLLVRMRTVSGMRVARRSAEPSLHEGLPLEQGCPGADRAEPHVLWLAAALSVGAFVYAHNYSPSSEALTLLGGAAAGQALALLSLRVVPRDTSSGPGGERAKPLCIRNPRRFVCLGAGVVGILLILLCLASAWRSPSGRDFAYQGHARWSGPWDNPNIFGLLMSAGMVLAVGQGAQRLKAEGQRLKEGKGQKVGARGCALGVLCLIAAGLMARGLLHSFSRGAWLATVCGLAYLAARLECKESPRFPRASRILRFMRKNCIPSSAILLSAVLLLFWHFRQTDWHPARRALSAFNTVDFSWRNRVAAWEGALQIAVEHPWLGEGWNQTERLHEQYYLSPKLNEGAAIEMNDYLMLAATLGIPALICFGMYVGLSLTRPSDTLSRPAGEGRGESAASDWSATACRAGAIVLLVGFWFDGGLFKLATASTFWILLELGSVGNHEPSEARGND
jgi:O-antigen ligase